MYLKKYTQDLETVMKRKILLLALCAVFVLSACTNTANNSDSSDEKAVLDATEMADMGLLAADIEMSNEMSAFLTEGLEKQDDMDLNMHFVNYLAAHWSLYNLYDGYTSHGSDYVSPYENKEDEAYVVYSTHRENREYGYSKLVYTYDDRETVVGFTHVTFSADKNFAESRIDLGGDLSYSVEQYYFGDGIMCIVRSQLVFDSLQCEVMYYKSGFIGVATIIFDNYTELTLPYDLTKETPSSFEDMLTEESYDRYFTYDGSEPIYITAK